VFGACTQGWAGLTLAVLAGRVARVWWSLASGVCGGATLVALPTTLLGGCRCSMCRVGSSLAARRPHCAPAVPGSSCVRCPCVVVEPPTSCRGTRRSRCARRINARLGARPAFTGGGGEQQLLGTCPKTRRRTCVCGWRRPVGGVVCRSRCPRLLIVAILVVAHVTTGPLGTAVESPARWCSEWCT
jgi:hypothetical protein